MILYTVEALYTKMHEYDKNVDSWMYPIAERTFRHGLWRDVPDCATNTTPTHVPNCGMK
jgi:hypothetical protein